MICLSAVRKEILLPYPERKNIQEMEEGPGADDNKSSWCLEMSLSFSVRCLIGTRTETEVDSQNILSMRFGDSYTASNVFEMGISEDDLSESAQFPMYGNGSLSPSSGVVFV